MSPGGFDVETPGGAGGINVVASNTTFTGGTVSLTGTGGGITVATAANQIQLSVLPPDGGIGVVASDATFTTGTVSISGTGEGITVNTAANIIRISGAQTGVKHLIASNNTFSSGTVSLTGVGEGITVNTAASKIQISGAQTGVKHLVASDNTFSSGTVSITGLGAAVVNTAASKIQISVPTQTVQPDTGSVIALGNTAGTTNSVPMSGQWALAGGANISLSMHSDSTSRVSIVGGAGGAGISALSASDTAFTGLGVRLTGSNMITVKSSGANTVVFDATQTAQPVGSLHPLGNTTGTTASIPFATPIALAGGNKITISGHSDSSRTLTISAANDLGSLIPLGNTTGTTNSVPASTNFALAGGNNITLSMHSDSSSRITISAASQSVAPVGSVVPLSNTTGTTASIPMSAAWGLAGGNNITLSGHSDSSSRLTISAPNTTNETQWNIGAHRNIDPGDVSIISHLSAISKTPMYFPMNLPGNIIPKSIGVRLSAVNTSTLQSFSVHLGIYSQVNSTSAALMGSASDSFNISTASSVSWSGMRDYVLTSPGTVAAISSLSAGRYVFGLMFSAGATGSMNYSLAGQVLSTAGQPIGLYQPGANSAQTDTSQGLNPLLGQGSTTVNAMPANVSRGDIRNQGSVTVPIVPYVFMRS